MVKSGLTPGQLRVRIHPATIEPTRAACARSDRPRLPGFNDERARRDAAPDRTPCGVDRIDAPLVPPRRQIGVDVNAGDAGVDDPFHRDRTGPVEDVDDIAS